MGKIEQRISGVDSLRGAASLYIIAYHVSCCYLESNKLVIGLLGQGFMTVQLFFCMSGFLIYHAYSLRSVSEPRPVLSFYTRRAFRILPLWWSLLLALFAFGVLTDPWVLITNMTFLFGFLSFSENHLPIVASWSLFVEEVFYLFFPFIYKSLKKVPIFAWFLLALIINFIWNKNAFTWGVPRTNHYIIRSPLANFQYIFLGMMIHFIYTSSDKIERIKRWNGSFPLTPLDFLWPLLFLGIVNNYPIPRLVFISVFFLTALLPQTLTFKLLNQTYLKWIGVRCYCVYIIHGKLGQILDGHLVEMVNKMTTISEMKLIVHFVLLTAATLSIAAITYFILEKPLLNLGNALIKRFYSKERLK